MFAIDYTGPAASQTWLTQFVWREVLGEGGTDDFFAPAKPVAGPITTSGGTYELTTVTPPSEANYNTDAVPGLPDAVLRGRRREHAGGLRRNLTAAQVTATPALDVHESFGEFALQLDADTEVVVTMRSVTVAEQT